MARAPLVLAAAVATLALPASATAADPFAQLPDVSPLDGVEVVAAPVPPEARRAQDPRSPYDRYVQAGERISLRVRSAAGPLTSGSCG